MNNIINQKVMKKNLSQTSKVLTFLVFCLAMTRCQECFGEECAHRSVVPSSSPADPIQVGRLIEAELRRQYWYYLRDSDLLYEKNYQLEGRIMFYYFHRNIVGTFFTICSWNIDGEYSEVNKLVRLGAGAQQGVKYHIRPVGLEPFVLRSQYPGNEEPEIIVLSDRADPVANGMGMIIRTAVDTESAIICYQQSNEFLREKYWFYLRNADETSQHTLSTIHGDYIVITFKNIVGEFMTITSCHSDGVQVNTFVRFGGTKNDPSQQINLDENEDTTNIRF